MTEAATPQSCLYRKIVHYIPLSEDDAAYLERLEADLRAFPARRRLKRAGEAADELFVVRSGWLYSVRYLGEGRRHVEGLHFPGDVIGLSDVTLKARSGDLITATDAVLCPIPKARMGQMFCEAPRIAGILFALSVVDSIIVSERLAVVSRLHADARIAHLLMQIHARLALTRDSEDDWFAMPLSQEVIGDAVSLTQAYVNRSLKELEDRGLILRRDNGVEIRDKAALAELGAFQNRFESIDDSWLPSDPTSETTFRST